MIHQANIVARDQVHYVTMPTMPRHDVPMTNEEFLRSLRFERELAHRHHLEWRFIHSHLVLPPTLPLPQVTLDHIQDSCNKSIPIYWIGPRAGGLILTLNLVYQKWFRGHKSDLEFGRFTAALIRIESPEMERVTVQDIVKVHNAWCEQIDTTMSSFYGDKVTVSDYSNREERGSIAINAEQHMHFKLQPLFRALCIVVDEPVENATAQIVYLVSTGIVTSGLSEPISLKGFEDEGTRGEISGRNVVTTTLPAAIEFVMELDKREQRACLDGRDLTVLDNFLGGISACNKYAQRRGYTGEEIQGPSTSWVPVSEGEAIVPPRTPISRIVR
jgi:hypothetical protein